MSDPLDHEDFASLKLLPTHFLEALLRDESLCTLHLTDGRTYQTSIADRVVQDAEGRLWFEFYVDGLVVSIRLSELRYVVEEQWAGSEQIRAAEERKWAGQGADPKEATSSPTTNPP